MPSPASLGADPPARRKPNFTRLVAALTGANAILAISSLVTGPLQARSLGPTGRGDLAAILVPVLLAPVLLDLGLTAFIVRARAQGRSRGELLGSLIPISVAFSLIGVIAAVPLSRLIADGRGTVETGLMIGLLLSPVWVTLLTAQGLPWGEERWRTATFVRVAAPVITAVSMTVLYFCDSLTVETAFIVFLGASALANAPLVYLMVRSDRWRFKPKIVREGTHFGVRAWLGNLFSATDARLDQVLMAGLVAPRELGLYAVAVSAANFPSSFIGAVAQAINPRVAQGNTELTRRSCRVSFFITTIATLAVVALVPILVPFLFGDAFKDAIVLTWVLLASTMSGAVSAALLSALSAAGHPGSAARAQLFVLVPTIAALIILLPSTGALGAAVIATVSSIVRCGALLHQALRVLGGRLREYLVIERTDLQAVRLAFQRRRVRTG